MMLLLPIAGWWMYLQSTRRMFWTSDFAKLALDARDAEGYALTLAAWREEGGVSAMTR